ncbi:MAG: glycosyltransferase family 4 protein [Planctomycetota bacterium]
MKVLLCHTYYRQRGGEDESFEAEAAVLESQGHTVIRYTRHNDEIADRSRLGIAAETIWSRGSARAVGALLDRHRPDVLHANNIFPLISPSIYREAGSRGVAVVQALRNYRGLCVNGLFLREGRVCTKCQGSAVAHAGVRHACYRGSRASSAVVALSQLSVRRQAVKRGGVDLFVTPSQFTRDAYADGGFDPRRIVVKPNFTQAPPMPREASRDYALYVGRVSEEKGVEVLCKAWARDPSLGRLLIVGDGPARERLEAETGDARVEWWGRCERERALELMAGAAFVVVPSVWYEVFGRTVVEAFAGGTPVIAARIGALPELVDHGRTGLLYEPHDAAGLAAHAAGLFADPTRARRLGEAARRRYAEAFTPERNYQMLIELYERAIRVRRGQDGGSG